MKLLRYFVIATILLMGVVWSLTFIDKGSASAGYPNGQYLASPQWLEENAANDHTVIVDVRTDDHFDGRLIPGAIRMPWTSFRMDDAAMNLAETFVGIDQAQKVLSENGIGRTDTIVLYDSIERDGGATASYVFWVLDVLGHKNKKILDGGIDAWAASGFDLDSAPKQLPAILYQAPVDDIQVKKLIEANFIYRRLGDPFYQIIDVRSSGEYLGQKASRDLRGNPLKLGHIPTAVNVDYRSNWIDPQSKKIKPYAQLQELYRGVDPQKAVIVYCDSGRRSSFSYFVLRLMGMDNVLTYEPSWKQWARMDNFYPVETIERKFAGDKLPTSTQEAETGNANRRGASRPVENNQTSAGSSNQPSGGYVSCGG